MSDAAAFFAQKKKKKAFKFNANLVDASTVTSTVHVDAPALSTEQDPLSVVTSAVFSAEIKDPLDKSKEQESAEQWDDEALVANTFKKNPVVVSSTPAATVGLLDMKSFDPKRTDPDNIAEKLRVEETKAQLAAAREGMEREAAKLKEERERKEQAKLDAEKSRFGSAAASMGGSGGKWVAPHLRASGAAALARTRLAGSASQKLDVQDEELFPDLAAADRILEKKEKDQAPVFKVAKKTPVGGGASWASKATTTPTAPAAVSKEPESVTTEEPKIEESKVENESETTKDDGAGVDTKIPPALAPASETVGVQPSVAKKTVVKKKKKDLSTFKPGS